MSKTPALADKTDTAPAKKPLVPPDDTFWQRYSAHHEAPLSGITSLAVHLLAIPLLLLVGWLLVKLGLGEDKGPVPVDTVQLLGGGGGSRTGTDSGGSDPDKQPRKDDERGDPKDASNPKPAVEPDERKPLDPVKGKLLETEFDNDANVKRLVQRPTLPFETLANQTADTRDKLRKSADPGKGQGGTGTDGGKDTGKDKGTGEKTGAGKGSLNQREKRILRWHMTFNTRNGQDYARQLQGLGAIVALPTTEKNKFLVIRDLSLRPVQPKVEDVAAINRIFWVDDVKDSVYALLHNGLGMKELPEYFVAFFPLELEERLLKIELDHQQLKTGERNEDVIHETKFNVVKKGDKYDVEIANQKYFK